MQTFTLIETSSGFAWAVFEAADPIAASGAAGRKDKCGPCTCREVRGPELTATTAGGYVVHEGTVNGWASMHGTDAGLIGAAEALPVTACVACHDGEGEE